MQDKYKHYSLTHNLRTIHQVVVHHKLWIDIHGSERMASRENMKGEGQATVS